MWSTAVLVALECMIPSCMVCLLVQSPGLRVAFWSSCLWIQWAAFKQVRLSVSGSSHPHVPWLQLVSVCTLGASIHCMGKYSLINETRLWPHSTVWLQLERAEPALQVKRHVTTAIRGHDYASGSAKMCPVRQNIPKHILECELCLLLLLCQACAMAIDAFFSL